jgi:ABC-type lipoprotein release transport system permease subunit
VCGINRLDLGSLAAVVSILLVAAVIASYLPARHPSKVDPIIALSQA